jgi:isoquinoline 1-oxidoreductase subunit beta
MVSRRLLILGTLGAAGAFGLGWCLTPPRSRLVPSRPFPDRPDGSRPLNGWVVVTPDDRVLIQVPKSEMGQGVLTSLAMILADEMDADWSRVTTEHPPLDSIYGNLAALVDGLPFHPDDRGFLREGVERATASVARELGLQMTGGSSSVKDLWLPMREAGAAARSMLLLAAARRWKVEPELCTVRKGEVQHVATGRRARFGELAAEAAALPVPKKLTLKTPEQFQLIGKDTPRLDAAAKARGVAAFAIDIRLPGMLYASVRMCPTLGGKVLRFTPDPALALPGVKKVLSFDGLSGGTGCVAVLADSPWHAMKGVEAVQVEWDAGPAASFDSDTALLDMSRQVSLGGGFAYHEAGDVAPALASAAQTVEAEYRAPWVAHMTMEPNNCTVHINQGRATVWAPTQVPGLARRAVHQATGLDEQDIDIRVQWLGGGFGRRLEVDFIAQAAAIAQHAGGLPVQTFWTRAEDTQHDFYRPAAVSRFKAGLDAQGAVVAWQNTSIGQSIVHQVVGRLLGMPGAGPDKTTAEGAYDQPYEWPAARIAHQIVDLPVPVGFWRAVGHSHQAFFKECFLDECAGAARADPVAYRAALLKSHPRHLAVLRKVTSMAPWGRKLSPSPDGVPRALGVALHQSFGSIVAQVAEVSVDSAKAIRVHRVWCAVDCGTAVNPSGIRQQMESGIVFGLSAALSGGVTIKKGQVQQSNFHDAPILRLNQSPAIFTEIMPSSAHPEGIGEPGTPPIAPAVANAIFALTGQRLRSLPLTLA